MNTRILLGAALVAVAASTGLAEDLTRNVEFSIGGAFQSLTLSKQPGAASSKPFGVPIRIGYFLLPDIECEAEFHVFSVRTEGESRDYIGASGSGVYNFRLHTASPRVRPFVLAGIGWAIPFNSLAGMGGGYWTPFLANLGAGVRAFLADRVALRVEYRYQHSFGDPMYPDRVWTSHALHMGLSMFL